MLITLIPDSHVKLINLVLSPVLLCITLAESNGVVFKSGNGRGHSTLWYMNHENPSDFLGAQVLLTLREARRAEGVHVDSHWEMAFLKAVKAQGDLTVNRPAKVITNLSSEPVHHWFNLSRPTRPRLLVWHTRHSIRIRSYCHIDNSVTSLLCNSLAISVLRNLNRQNLEIESHKVLELSNTKKVIK